MSEEGPERTGATHPGHASEGAAGLVAAPTTDEEIPRAGAWAHFVAGLVPLVVGILSLIYSIGLGIGGPTDPGPGLWPSVISVVLVVASVVLLLFGRRPEDYEKFTSGARVIALGVVSLGVFVVVFQFVGFELPTLLIFVFWLRFLGGESWRTTALVAVGATVAFYALFIVLLGIPLPHIAL